MEGLEVEAERRLHVAGTPRNKYTVNTRAQPLFDLSIPVTTARQLELNQTTKQWIQQSPPSVSPKQQLPVVSLYLQGWSAGGCLGQALSEQLTQ